MVLLFSVDPPVSGFVHLDHIPRQLWLFQPRAGSVAVSGSPAATVAGLLPVLLLEPPTHSPSLRTSDVMHISPVQAPTGSTDASGWNKWQHYHHMCNWCWSNRIMRFWKSLSPEEAMDKFLAPIINYKVIMNKEYNLAHHNPFTQKDCTILPF